MGDTGIPEPSEVDRQQALDEGADALGPPAPPDCSWCGLAQDRRPTHYRAWVLLEPEPAIPGHLVPVGERWRIDGNGKTAYNFGDEDPRPGEQFRIAHRLVCPGFTQGDIEDWLIAMRVENRRRSDRTFDRGEKPEYLPEVG